MAQHAYCENHPLQELQCPICVGSKGGNNTARLYSGKHKKWGKLGGRPPKKKRKTANKGKP